MNSREDGLRALPRQARELDERIDNVNRPTPATEETLREKDSSPEAENDHALCAAFYYWVNSRP